MFSYVCIYLSIYLESISNSIFFCCLPVEWRWMTCSCKENEKKCEKCCCCCVAPSSLYLSVVHAVVLVWGFMLCVAASYLKPVRSLLTLYYSSSTLLSSSSSKGDAFRGHRVLATGTQRIISSIFTKNSYLKQCIAVPQKEGWHVCGGRRDLNAGLWRSGHQKRWRSHRVGIISSVNRGNSFSFVFSWFYRVFCQGYSSSSSSE